MTDRFFALIGGGFDDHDGVAATVADDPLLHIAYARPGCLVVVERGASVVPVGDRGVVIGPLFAAGRNGQQHALSQNDAAAVTASAGRYLTQAFWGGYVAILPGGGHDSVDVVRAPFGELPCFYARTESRWIVASDVALLERYGGFQPALDWPALGRFLCAPALRSTETCLHGLHELRGGDRLTLAGSAAATACLWSPWTFAATDRQLLDPVEAAHRLRGEVVSAVAARGSTAERSVLMLSGGLDSSVVACAAAQDDLALSCVNVRTNDPGGDERRYARSVCDHLGFAVEERAFALNGIDLDRSAAAALPRPVSRAFEYEARRQAHAVAAEVGADLVLTGGGGDNIFCSLQSVAPLLDCLTWFPDRREFWRVAREISAFCDASLVTVVRRAWLRSWRKRRPIPTDVDLRFLSSAAREQGSTLPRHPWLQPPGTVLPGKAAHVSLLLGTQHLTEDSDPQADRRLLSPLISQPVVELCLRIPSWMWFDRGCNRAVARHAFDADLPPDVAWRRSKGSPDSFLVEMFDANRASIRALLLHGNLARHGLLDTEAIATHLDDRGPVQGSGHVRILRLVDIEAWTRCWPA